MDLKNILIIFLVLIVLGGFFTAIYMRLFVMEPRIKKIKNGLITPYLELVRKEEFKQAYNQYTSKIYQTRISFDEYLRFYKEEELKYGHLQSFEFTKDSSPFTENRESDLYQIVVRLQFEKDWESAVFEVKKQNGSYQINGSYTENQDDSLTASSW